MTKAIVVFFILLVCFQLNEANQQEKSITLELKKMYEADQEERGLLYSGQFDPFQLDINDSIRLNRVIELDKSNLLRTLSDKYYAAWIYHHGGGPGMKDDSLYLLRAIRLYDEILNSPVDEIIIDTLNLAEIRGTIYHELPKARTPETIIKIDTILSSNRKDTSLVFYVSVKKVAKSSKSLSEGQFERLYSGKSEKAFPSLDLNKLENPEYQRLARELIKERIKKGLFEKSLQLSEEQIDALVDEQIKTLIHLRESYIKGIKQDTTR